MSWERLRALPRWPLDVAATAVLVVLVPVQRVASIHQGYGWRAAVAGAVALLASALLLGRSRLPERWQGLGGLVAIAGGSALLGAAAGGRIVGGLLLVCVPLGAWVGAGWPLPGLGAFPRRAVLPVAVVAFGASRVLRSHDRLATGMMWLAAAAGLALVLRRWPDLPRRAVEGARRLLQAALPVVLLGPLWVLTALIPWLLGRAVRHDPLTSPVRGGSGWVPRRDRPVDGGRLWFPDPLDERPPLRMRLHAKAPTILGVLLVLVAVGGKVWVDVVAPAWHPPPATEAEGDLRGAPWGDDLLAETQGAVEAIWFSQWVGNEWSDRTGEHVNVSDGRRATWRSERCAAEQPVVWMFGGSAAFGVHHRDGRTIASELARQSDRAGRPIVVENFGMPGDVAWQQNRRLERELAGGQRPDVVIYYDGWNDLRAVADMDFAGRSADPDFIGPMDRTQFRMLTNEGGLAQPGRRTIEVPTPGPGLPADEVIERAAASYANAHRTAQLLADAAGIGFVHVYQPSVHTRTIAVAGDVRSDPTARALVRGFRAELPDDVVDIASVLRPADGAVYPDEVHPLEAAAPPIAAAILEELAPVLDEATGRTGRWCP